jgi:hypothetical protein
MENPYVPVISVIGNVTYESMTITQSDLSRFTLWRFLIYETVVSVITTSVNQNIVIKK